MELLKETDEYQLFLKDADHFKLYLKEYRLNLDVENVFKAHVLIKIKRHLEKHFKSKQLIKAEIKRQSLCMQFQLLEFPAPRLDAIVDDIVANRYYTSARMA